MMNKRNNREYSGKVLIGEDCTMDEYNADTCPYAYMSVCVPGVIG